MKPRNLLFLALLLCCSIELDAQQHQHPLLGTWEMISGKGTDADGNKFSFNTSTVRETKIITPTHYMLIAQDVKEDAIIFNRSLAGTVRIEGNKYIETPMFSSDEEHKKIKTDFTWRVEGDKFIQQGIIMLPDGKKITVDQLVFQRVKSDKSYANNPSIGVWDQLSSSYIMADGTKDAHTNATETEFEMTEWALWPFYW